jgi:hypothetical protein
MADLDKFNEIQSLKADRDRLRLIAAYYKKLIKSVVLTERLPNNYPSYAMTLYFQLSLDDESQFYTRTAKVIDKLIEILEEEE